MNKPKLIFLATIYAVTLHYLFVAGLTTRASAWVSFTLAITTLVGAVLVWELSGFGKE